MAVLEPILMVAVAAALASLLLGLNRELFKSAAAKRRVWEEGAAALGLTEPELKGIFPRMTLTGHRDGMKIRVEGHGDADGAALLAITVWAHDFVDASLELRPESATTALEKLKDGPDLELGDEEFDASVLVRGEPLLMTALLGFETRQRIRHLVTTAGSVRHGRLSMTVVRKLAGSADLAATANEAIEMAQALQTPADPAELLRRNATRDPLSEVRLRNLRLLVEHYRSRTLTTETLRQALTDQDLEVRLLAAVTLGDEARDVLQALANDPGAPDTVNAGAMRALGPAFGVEQTLGALDRALNAGRRRVALAAVEVLGACASDAAATELCRLLEGGDGELAEAAAHALSGYAEPASEAALIAALAHEVAAVRVAAAEALTAAGTVAAVAGLRAAQEAHPRDHELKRAVLVAIAEIQGRATGAAPGQLSLSAGEAGELALTADEAGQVSLVDPQEPTRDET